MRTYILVFIVAQKGVHGGCPGSTHPLVLFPPGSPHMGTETYVFLLAACRNLGFIEALRVEPCDPGKGSVCLDNPGLQGFGGFGQVSWVLLIGTQGFLREPEGLPRWLLGFADGVLTSSAYLWTRQTECKLLFS